MLATLFKNWKEGLTLNFFNLLFEYFDKFQL